MAEKFSKWADRAGINPFVPCKAPIAISSGGKAAAYSLWILVGVPRIALSLFIAILVMVAPFVVNVGSIMFISASAMLLRGSNLPNVDEFPPVFQALLDDENKSLVFGIAIFFTIISVAVKSLQRLLIKLAMFILGVRFEIAPANLRRLGLGAAGGASEKPAADQAVFAPGDIVVANFTNVFEILALECYLRSPIFVFPSKPGTSLCTPLSLYAAIRHAVSTYAAPSTLIASPSTLDVVVASARKDSRIVVLFLEGLRTNGDGVLEYCPEVLEPLIRASKKIGDCRVHALGFQYPSPEKGFSIPHPVGPFLPKLFWITSTNILSGYVVSAETIPSSALKPLPSTAVMGAGASLVDAASARLARDFAAELRVTFASLIKKNIVQMGWRDQASFAEYYAHLAAGRLKEAANIADSRSKQGSS